MKLIDKVVNITVAVRGGEDMGMILGCNVSEMSEHNRRYEQRSSAVARFGHSVYCTGPSVLLRTSSRIRSTAVDTLFV